MEKRKTKNLEIKKTIFTRLKEFLNKERIEIEDEIQTELTPSFAVRNISIKNLPTKEKTQAISYDNEDKKSLIEEIAENENVIVSDNLAITENEENKVVNSPRRVVDDTYYAEERRLLKEKKKRNKLRVELSKLNGYKFSREHFFSSSHILNIKQKRVSINKHRRTLLPQWIKEVKIYLILSGIILFSYFSFNHFFGLITIYSDDVSTSLKMNDRVILAYKDFNHQYERGDIVLLDNSSLKKELDFPLLIQRVVGVPGDEVEIIRGKVYINKKELSEPYLSANSLTELDTLKHQKIVLGENMYYTLLDNRTLALDSRTLGAIWQDDIRGKLVYTVWPLNKWGSVR